MVQIDKSKIWWGILILSVCVNMIFICKTFSGNVILEEGTVTDAPLIDSSVAEMNQRAFLEAKQNYIASYTPLREELDSFLEDMPGEYGVYFEELDSHSWVGINERSSFTPASLLKIATAASILSLVEDGKLSLDQRVVLSSDDLNSNFGELYQNEGSEMSVKELIESALRNSDNTAVKALHHHFISEDKWIETRLALGLPLVSISESAAGTKLTPKEFSRVFHSLYYSGYLSRESSNWVLSLLSQTEFREGIPAGVPEEIKVAHKIGEWDESGSVHDCGIVYAKKRYILCIMSMNTNKREGNEVISKISEIVYSYISRN